MNQQNPKNQLNINLVSVFSTLTPYRKRLLVSIGIFWTVVAVLFQFVFTSLMLPNLGDSIAINTSGPKNPVTGVLYSTASTVAMVSWVLMAVVALAAIVMLLGALFRKTKIWLPSLFVVYILGATLVGRLIGIAISNYYNLGQTLYEALFTVILLGATFWVYVWLANKPTAKAK